MVVVSDSTFNPRKPSVYGGFVFALTESLTILFCYIILLLDAKVVVLW